MNINDFNKNFTFELKMKHEINKIKKIDFIRVYGCDTEPTYEMIAFFYNDGGCLEIPFRPCSDPGHQKDTDWVILRLMIIKALSMAGDKIGFSEEFLFYPEDYQKCLDRLKKHYPVEVIQYNEEYEDKVIYGTMGDKHHVDF